MPPPIRIGRSSGIGGLGLREAWERRELLYFLVWRDFKVRHKQALLGYLWLVIQPLGLMLLYSLFFSLIAKIPSEGVPYPLYLLAALVPWRFFASSLTTGASSVMRASALLKQVYFPRIYLPIAGVLTGAVNTAVAFLVLLGVMLYFGMWPSARIILIVPLFLLLAALGLSLSLIAASVNTYVRDVAQSIPIVVQGWMYASPVVYPLHLVPEPVRDIYVVNPMVGIVQGFRWATLGVGPSPWALLLLSAGVTLVLFVVGLLLFRRFDRNFADVI